MFVKSYLARSQRVAWRRSKYFLDIYISNISMCLRQSPHVAFRSVFQQRSNKIAVVLNQKWIRNSPKGEQKGSPRLEKEPKGSQRLQKVSKRGAKARKGSPSAPKRTLLKMYRKKRSKIRQFRIPHPLFCKSVELSFASGGGPLKGVNFGSAVRSFLRSIFGPKVIKKLIKKSIRK